MVNGPGDLRNAVQKALGAVHVMKVLARVLGCYITIESK